MNKRHVDVFDRYGAHLAPYTVLVDEEDCHEQEIEEIALLLAEKGGHVEDAEIVHLRARCVP